MPNILGFFIIKQEKPKNIVSVIRIFKEEIGYLN